MIAWRGVVLIALVGVGTMIGTAESLEAQPGVSRAGTWDGRLGAGFLADTPDGTVPAVNGYLDYFLSDAVSAGPLLQWGFNDDLQQIGLSMQAKYHIPLPTADQRTSLALQSGLGFVHADLDDDDDTSWLIPCGAGIVHTLTSGTRLAATVLINLADLEMNGGDAHVMPGVMFDVGF